MGKKKKCGPLSSLISESAYTEKVGKINHVFIKEVHLWCLSLGK